MTQRPNDPTRFAWSKRLPKQGAEQRSSHRPPGELLWVHATSRDRLAAVCDISVRLKTLRPDLSVLLTRNAELESCAVPSGCDLDAGVLATENVGQARSFLDKWEPDLCLWTGGDLRQALIRQAQERDVDLLLVDIELEEIPPRKRRWLVEQSHALLDRFDLILTSSAAAIDHLKRRGLSDHKLQLSSALSASVSPPMCNDDELSETSDALRGRPVWLATHAQPDEFGSLLEAHKQALRQLHRLLLVVVPHDQESVFSLEQSLDEAGLRFANWDNGEQFDDNTQVLISSVYELGLWYRVAPVSFLGSSLARSDKGISPLEAMALGSAVLHGPGISAHRALYERVGALGASLKVINPQELTAQVLRLSVPDKAAAMALAGWQVVTDGARLTDRLIEEIQSRLDQREERHATT
jgi:3-deoxy-D-manno-octulosonic-acid transferase